MLVERRVHLVVEVVQERRHAPELLVLAELPRVRGRGRLDGERVPQQRLALRVARERLPGTFASRLHRRLILAGHPEPVTKPCQLGSRIPKRLALRNAAAYTNSTLKSSTLGAGYASRYLSSGPGHRSRNLPDRFGRNGSCRRQRVEVRARHRSASAAYPRTGGDDRGEARGGAARWRRDSRSLPRPVRRMREL